MDPGGTVTIFDPYDTSQPTTPGLNTGSAPDVSTLTSSPVPRSTIGYRSGALAGLTTAFGLTCLLLGAVMAALGIAWSELCDLGDLPTATCASRPSAIWTLAGLVPILGLMAAAIIGSLAKSRKNGAALIGLLVGTGLVVFALSQFAGLVGLGA